MAGNNVFEGMIPMNIYQGWTIWLTGLPAAGKSTLARAVCERLRQMGVVSALLDSDELRPIIALESGYDDVGRGEFYLRLTRLARLLTRDGVNVLIAATGNRRNYRDCAAQVLAPFAEVWVRCPIEICQARDPKGLYAGVAVGNVEQLPGVNAVYEPPLTPTVIVDTDQQSVTEAAEIIMAGVPFLRAQVWEYTRT
jgi:adenylylsulfate kinase